MMKKVLLFLWEVFKIVVLALVIVIPIRYLVFQPFIVNGASMEPNFHSGDYLIIDELTYRFRDPQRGEVVVFRYPKDPSQRFIKRIVGLPGEKIVLKNAQIEITDKFGKDEFLDESNYLLSSVLSGGPTITLGEDEYFVLGDNRSHSFDSRNWGALKRENIIGRTIIRAWPTRDMAYFTVPEY